jgi:hypothetical protein
VNKNQYLQYKQLITSILTISLWIFLILAFLNYFLGESEKEILKDSFVNNIIILITLPISIILIRLLKLFFIKLKNKNFN